MLKNRRVYLEDLDKYVQVIKDEYEKAEIDLEYDPSADLWTFTLVGVSKKTGLITCTGIDVPCARVVR